MDCRIGGLDLMGWFLVDTQNNDNYISLEDAAKYIGIKSVTLRGWIKNSSNEVPAHKVGRLWKFKRSELDEWINSGKSAINNDRKNNQ